MLINKSIFIAVASSLLCSCALAQGWQPCPSKDSYHLSLTELVSEASFIGLFEVLEATRDEKSAYDDIASYTYKLTAVSILKNSGPRIVFATIVGSPPIKDIPQYYLAMNERHGLFDLNDPGELGSTAVYRLSNSSKCAAAPTFKIGYQYLVFGGVDSKAAFEPIHSTKTDPWYLAVRRAVDQ